MAMYVLCECFFSSQMCASLIQSRLLAGDSSSTADDVVDIRENVPPAQTGF